MPHVAPHVRLRLLLAALWAAATVVVCCAHESDAAAPSPDRAAAAAAATAATATGSVVPTTVPTEEPAPRAPAGHPDDAHAPVIDERLHELTPRPASSPAP